MDGVHQTRPSLEAKEADLPMAEAFASHAAVFVCVGVKGALSPAGFHRDWLLSI